MFVEFELRLAEEKVFDPAFNGSQELAQHHLLTEMCFLTVEEGGKQNNLVKRKAGGCAKDPKSFCSALLHMSPVLGTRARATGRAGLTFGMGNWQDPEQ